MALIEEFLQKGAQGTSAVLVAELIWSVPNPCEGDLLSIGTSD